MRNAKILFWFGIILVVVGVVIIATSPADRFVGPETGEWRIYRNDAFGFEIQYPSDWQVAEFPDDIIVPKFNIYKPDSSDREPPYDHFSDATHVSIFPYGIPTEGVFAETEEAQLSAGVPITRATNFLNADGAPWASYVQFEDTPESWQEPGFVWLNVKLENMRTACLHDGEEIPEAQCDPFTGDMVIHYGDVDESLREVELRMLETFRFLSDEEVNVATYFRDEMWRRGVENLGGNMPIEGFDPELYMGAFPGLVPEDFNNVQALLGKYVYANSELMFFETVGQPIHTAARTVSNEGMATLLENISSRLDIDVSSNSAIDVLLDALSEETVLDDGAMMEDKSDLIRVSQPQPNAVVTSPLMVTGEARGFWFFEASAPMVITNWDGLIIGESYIEVTPPAEWMTENFVPFHGTIMFDTPDYGDTGALIIQKDNPSGLPQFDDAVEIPIRFK